MADGGVMLRCALRYAKLGLRVVPCWWPAGTACACSQGRGCRSPAKHPLIAKWQDAATTDGDTIRSWWSHWPVANIGAVLGPHRLLLDADKAKNGLVTLARLEREHTPLPVEWSAVSGGGGRHHLFTLPDGLTITSRPERFGPGLDARSGAAYFLVESSRHVSGGHYKWLQRPLEGEPPPAPPWLLELLDQASSAPSREQQPDHHVGEPGNRVQKGKRHDSLVGFARRIRAGCKSYDEFEAALVGWGGGAVRTPDRTRRSRTAG